MPEEATPSETPTETVETTETHGTEESTEQKQPPKPTETVEFWKAKAREQEKRAKDNADKASKFDQVTAAQKSEVQLAIERAEAAERRASELETAQQVAGWKSQVAKDPQYAGITADVLRGSSLEEIEEHAASLKALLPEPRKAGHVPSEGRTVSAGSASPRDQFAALLRGSQNP